MQSKIKYFLFASSVMAYMGCRTVPQGKVEVNPAPVSLMPDAEDSTRLEVTFRVPENYLTRQSRLVIVPQLMVGDSVYSEYSPVVLDAAVYRKKVERLEVLEAYRDPYAAEAKMVDHKRAYEIPYRQDIVLPDGEMQARVRAVLTTDGCGECTGTDTLFLAEVSDPMSLFDPQLYRVDLTSDFVVRPKIREGKGVANLQFIINRYDIRMDLGNNEAEMKKMLQTLAPILKDSLAVMNKLAITGLASADGSLAFNTTLSRNRALSAKQWLTEQAGLPWKVQRIISVNSRPEGWEPVLEAMRRAGDKDTVAVARILERYADKNDDVQEYHIRRLPAWNRIKDNYLQKDRSVEYVYSYTIKSFTSDKELLTMFRRRPDAFNEDELLRVSSLVKTQEEKKEVYETTLRFFPQSVIAANNLAGILLDEDMPVEAAKVLEQQGRPKNAVVANTLAMAYARTGRQQEAVEVLKPFVDALPEARKNAGVIQAQRGEYEAAYELLRPQGDVNAVLLALRTGRIGEARKMLNQLDQKDPTVKKLKKMCSNQSL